MNKTAIKNFAVWARVQLVNSVKNKTEYYGITANGYKEIEKNGDVLLIRVEGKRVILSKEEARIREQFIDMIKTKNTDGKFATAYESMVEEVAYTWFNRIIAIRFMEINGYLPNRVRVLSSETAGKTDSDLMTNPFDADLTYTDRESDLVWKMKDENKQDELFQFLFVKECNYLGEYLPELFERMADYTELFIDIKYTDKDSVVRRIVTDIAEEDFKEAVEIIGWMYQYYISEVKQQVFDGLKKNVKINKETIPAATQLFTPDWIVRYMVENSLGKKYIDYLKTKGDLQKVERLKGEWKYYIDSESYETIDSFDVTKITFIDPCMGSGHILVYAFKVLHDIYLDFGFSEREISTLILKNNLYGIDIDTRAYQLAYFALMMKGVGYDRSFLRAKKVQALNVSDFTESNAYPYHTADVYAKIKPLFTETDVETIIYLINTFRNGLTYGSIIQVENREYLVLAEKLKRAKDHAHDLVDLDVVSATVDGLIKLCDLAELLNKKYDVVCTNPPYMGASGMDTILADYIKKNYPDSKSDLFAVFIEQCMRMAKPECYTAMITMQSWMFLSSFEKLRANITQNYISSMAHLGARAFEEIGGEVVQTTAFVLKNEAPTGKGTYIRLIDFNSQQAKENAFIDAINDNACKYKFYRSSENFSKIPGSPLAYWVSDRFIKIFENTLINNFADCRQGLITGNNDRFLKMWFEVDYNKTTINGGEKWYPYNKGGEFHKWYGNNYLVVNWENDGYEIRNYRDKTGKMLSRPQNIQYFFKESITWTSLTSGSFNARYSPVGFIFDAKGSSMFLINEENIWGMIAYMNSKVSNSLLLLLAPTLDYNAGVIAKLPYIYNNKKKLQEIAQESVNVSKTDWDSFETSWDFNEHPLVRWSHSLWDCTAIGATMTKFYGANKPSSVGSMMELCYLLWQGECNQRFNTLKANEEELNRIFIDIYGLQDELSPEEEEKDVTVRKADLGREIRSFISYAVGCMFGRYSLNEKGLAYAGGEWNEEKYRSYQPDKDNVIPITDEEYFDDDIVGRFIQFVKTVYGADDLEANLDFIANALGEKGITARETIRKYFLNDFYADHLKIYQKRPIYWQLDSGKNNGFKALIYMHRYTPDTFGIARTDYLHKVQRIYENEISRMDELSLSGEPRERVKAIKRKEKLVKQLQETHDYDMVLGHIVAERIAIDLDDGVKVNYAKFQDIEVSTDMKKARMNVLTVIK